MPSSWILVINFVQKVKNTELTVTKYLDKYSSVGFKETFFFVNLVFIAGILFSPIQIGILWLSKFKSLANN